MSLFFLREDGDGNITNEDGIKAMDFEIEGNPYNLNKLTDFEMFENNSTEAGSSIIDTVSDKSQQYMLHDRTTRGLFFYWRLQKGLSVRAAASRANVSHSTANNWYQKYLSDPENYEMEKKRPTGLREPHKQHLIDFFDEKPSAVITEAIDSLTAAFEGLDIKKSRVHEFMKDEFSISLKVATLHPRPCNDEVGSSVDGQA
ncbi:hypothetical protein EDC94DRAFT_627068 [Helicostylum pulchrum]|nr:hypothetical protein EDC94DRAFT_627068 [Helicostylum pulchrum]